MILNRTTFFVRVFKTIFVLLILLFNKFIFFAQSYNMSNTTIQVCGGTFYDEGGVSGNYSNGSTLVMTFLPVNPGEGVCLDFTQWDLDYNIFGYSEMSFYDGASTSAPLIMTATGDWTTAGNASLGFEFTGPGMVCSTTGALTVSFDPDDSAPGWEADISCYNIIQNPGCSITASSSNNSICPGDSVQLNAVANLISAPLNNDFNNSTVGSGWSTSVNARFDNPCGPGLDGTPHLWMGVEPSPRVLMSQSYDMSNGGAVSFDFKMAIQANGAPCEGPDEVDEGVYLQYSVNGGANWNTLHYFFPPHYTDGSNHCSSWQNYVFNVPLLAQTNNTIFRWIQNAISSNTTDHWGLDNVLITSSVPSTITWTDLSTGNTLTSSSSSPLSINVSPVATTTYRAEIFDGISSCSEDVTILVNSFTTSVTDPSSCTSSDGLIAINAIGSGPFEYSIDNGVTFQSSNSFSGLVAGNYDVVVLDQGANNCQLSQQVIVNSVGTVPTINGDTNICENSVSQLIGSGSSAGSNPWFSSDPSIASVDVNGLVSGLSSGIATITYTDNNGCFNSVAIEVNSVITNALSFNICFGDTLSYNGANYYAGNLTGSDTLISNNGCDSIVLINVVELPLITNSYSASICENDSISYNGTVYHANNLSGSDTLVSLSGCDSVVLVNFTLLPISSGNIDAVICPGGSFQYNGVVYDANNLSGTDTVQSVNGCDSILTITVTVQNVLSGELNATLCYGDSLVFNGVVYNANNPSGVDTVLSSSGCDSVIVINVVELPLSQNYIDTTLFMGETLEFNGAIFDESNSSGQVLLTDVNGCDSIVFVELSFLEGYVHFVPSGFSPNFDGVNDILYVMGGGIEEVSFMVFNRWGEVVFETDCCCDETCGWDGSYKNIVLNNGVYVYMLSGKYINGVGFEEKGTISLIK